MAVILPARNRRLTSTAANRSKSMITSRGAGCGCLFLMKPNARSNYSAIRPSFKQAAISRQRG